MKGKRIEICVECVIVWISVIFMAIVFAEMFV